jgi:hypothetical protein
MDEENKEKESRSQTTKTKKMIKDSKGIERKVDEFMRIVPRRGEGINDEERRKGRMDEEKRRETATKRRRRMRGKSHFFW